MIKLTDLQRPIFTVVNHEYNERFILLNIGFNKSFILPNKHVIYFVIAEVSRIKRLIDHSHNAVQYLFSMSAKYTFSINI